MVGIFIAAAQAQAALAIRARAACGDRPTRLWRVILNLPTRRADKFRLSTGDAHKGASRLSQGCDTNKTVPGDEDRRGTGQGSRHG